MALDIIIILILVLLGLALIMVEIFFLPGITIAGIGGGIILVGGIVYAFHYMGENAGYITIGTSAVLGVGTFIFLIKSKTLDRISLKTDITSKIDQSDRLHIKVGDQGVTLSRINPIGKAEFENELVIEVKSFTGEFIDTEVEIEVVKTDNFSILVQPRNLV